MKIGPTKFSAGGDVKFGRYSSGETAIQIIGEDGMPELKATVSVVPYGADDPGDDGVWIKDWSENEGIADALIKAGMIELTGNVFRTGFIEAQHARLTPQALSIREKQGAA